VIDEWLQEAPGVGFFLGSLGIAQIIGIARVG